MTGSSSASSECIFCSTSEAGRNKLLLVRGRLCYVILNKYPYNNGHLMVVPKRHVGRLAGVTVPVQAVQQRFPKALIQFEDLLTPNA